MSANTADITGRDLIVFTDLDGTLLDHHSYDHIPALPTLARLARANIPLILASSKTAAEMMPLRSELGLGDTPMICENGAGVVFAGEVKIADYARLRAELDAMITDLREGFEGFGDMTPARIADLTGLDETAATLAADRQFSEPGIWTGTDENRARFLGVLRASGIYARQGGRFLTLSFGADKADHMKQIQEHFGRKTVIALGDAPNDAEMLQAADYAIILPNAQGNPVLDITQAAAQPEVIYASAPGPTGWHAALGALLTRLGVAK